MSNVPSQEYTNTSLMVLCIGKDSLLFGTLSVTGDRGAPQGAFLTPHLDYYIRH